ncbi:MAG: hypothetical protein WBD34_00660 [Burkholderiaceae bacterium]
MNGYSIADFVPYDAAAWEGIYAQYLAGTGGFAVTQAGALLVCLVIFYWCQNLREMTVLWPLLTVLAINWAWLGLVFHGQWHQQLNWAAHYWVVAFVVQAGLLMVAAVWALIGQREAPQIGHVSTRKWSVSGLLLLPWVVPPLAGWLIGNRQNSAWEFVGSAPDPTAWFTVLMTLLLLNPTNAAAAGRALYPLLLIIPATSLGISVAAASVTMATDLLATQLVCLLSIVLAGILKWHATHASGQSSHYRNARSQA